MEFFFRCDLFLPEKTGEQPGRKFGCGREISPHFRIYEYGLIITFSPQKEELTVIAKTPNPGILRALISVSLK